MADQTLKWLAIQRVLHDGKGQKEVMLGGLEGFIAVTLQDRPYQRRVLAPGPR